MEKFPTKINLNEKLKSNIEKTANYEGNDSFLLHERMQNKEIKEKMIDMFCEYQESIEPPERLFKDGKEIPISEWKKELKSREEIEKELNEKINKVFSSTDIDYSLGINSHTDGDNEVGLIFNNGINPDTGDKWTVKQLSICEAHEKGHCIRNFYNPGKSFKEKILNGFDFSNIKIPDKIIEQAKLKNKNAPEDLIKENFISYFSRPTEIIERMSQLKNYFGMKGVEKFTKEHLEYAKLHYSKDTGLGDYSMKTFFDAITPEKEKNFLDLMNSLGI